jgi:hypothetical protein
LMANIARLSMVLMIPYGRLRRIILGTDDPTERKVRFIALLTSSLPKNAPRPVLASGSAIEIYLDGVLRTGDMDIVYDVVALKRILKSWKFEQGGGLRSWLNDELGLAVDMVGKELNGSYERVTTITTPYGPATIIGIEDLILKRLASAKFWKAATDLEQAYLLLNAHGDRIDWDYLGQEAEKVGVTDLLDELKRALRSKGTRLRRKKNLLGTES